MSYTLEQKREAVKRNELWWRFPNELGAGDRAWSLCGCGISSSEAEYHIGPTAPTPPRVLSELEGELLEACKRLIGSLGVMIGDPDNDGDIIFARAAIKKAEAT